MLPEPQPAPTIVGGMRTLRELLILAFVAAFIVVFGDFIRDIWKAEEGQPPQFNDGLVALAGSLAGVLGSAFAVALGVAKPAAEQIQGKLARPRRKLAGLSISVTVGIWPTPSSGPLPQ